MFPTVPREQDLWQSAAGVEKTVEDPVLFTLAVRYMLNAWHLDVGLPESAYWCW